MNKKIINPEEYEYLWSNYDVPYLINYWRIVGAFKNSDMVLAYDPPSKETRFFLSIAQHKKIGEDCLPLFLSAEKYEAWRTLFLRETNICKDLAARTRSHAAEVTSMPIEELRKNLFERIEASAEFLVNYWYYTNFFSVEKAEALVAEDPEVYAGVKKNLEDLGHIKYAARDVLNAYISNEVFRPYTAEIGKKVGRSDVDWLSPAEIASVLDGGEVPLSNRADVPWILAKQYDWQLIEGAEAEQCIAALNAAAFKMDGDRLSGVVASKGIYRGRARVIPLFFSDATSAEVGKMQQGEVLVANSTGPELMVACQRAGAIVTDEGGLTSHAAVVSRELKIPCIVGTKIGSKFIQNGDEVEVDANNGIVRVIKRT